MANSEKLNQGGEGGVLKPKNQDNAKAKAKSKPKPKRRPKSKMLPPFNVVLLDDNDHTVDYVVEMLRKVFGYPDEAGGVMVKTLDTTGRVVVLTTHKELAELKCEQILAYGADWRLERSKGAMTAVVEPAEGGEKP
jgi:ATP-dependent Clp protease adaptor protein ClpS